MSDTNAADAGTTGGLLQSSIVDKGTPYIAAAWQLDVPQRKITAGPGLHELFGLPPDAVIDVKFVRSVIHPADVAEPVQALERFMREGGMYQRRYRLLLPDGRIRFIENTALVLGEKDGAPTIVSGIMRELGSVADESPKTKQTSEALPDKLQELVASDMLFKTAIEEEKLSLFLQDDRLRYLWRSNAIERFYESTPDTGDVRVALRGEEAERVEKAKLEVIRTGEKRDVSGWYHDLTGKPGYFRAILRPFPFPDGSTGIIGSSRDITEERLKAEKIEAQAKELRDKVAELEQAELRLTTAMQDSPVAVWTQDENQVFRWSLNVSNTIVDGDMDGMVEEDFGFSDEVVAAIKTLKQRVMYSGQPERLESWLHFRGKASVYLSAMLKPYDMPNGKRGLIGRYIDLTELKLVQEHVERLNQELSARLDALTSLHESKTREIAEAHQLQAGMLPHAPPAMPGLQIAALMETSAEVGGDYYDYCPLPDGNGFVFALGDATGHGLRAGFIVAMVKAYFQINCLTLGPTEQLAYISAKLEQMQLKQMYMALAIGRYDASTGRISFAQAGMPPLLVYRAATQRMERIHQPAMFLGTGLAALPTLAVVDCTLQAGDIALFATDGLMEARNPQGQVLTEGTLGVWLTEDAALPPTALAQMLMQRQRAWHGKEVPDDDTTMLIFKRDA